MKCDRTSPTMVEFCVPENAGPKQISVCVTAPDIWANGRTIQVKVPAGTVPGSMMRVKAKSGHLIPEPFALSSSNSV